MKKADQSVTNQRLIDARRQHAWLQQEVADQIGTTRVTVSRWEQGITLPNPYFRQKLCSLFEKSKAELGLLVDTVSKDKEQTPPSSSHNQDGASFRIWYVPHQRNSFFTGRDAVLTHLYYTLHLHENPAVTQVQAISGLGGIGKTQIAAEYAYRYHDDYHAVLWVRAETPEMLIADFVAFADLLNLPQKGEQNQHCVVEAVKHWLKNSMHWLLILDNVEDFTVANETIPWESSGHVILTTRAQSMGIFAHRIELKQMEFDEATLFLLRRARLIKRDASLEDTPEALRVPAKAIAVLLNGLSLALDQASAYIEDTGCSLSDYLDQYQIRRGILLDRRGSLVTDHPETVSRILSLCFEAVERISPTAANVLRLCVFLAADAIPEEIIAWGLRELDPISQPIVADFAALDDALVASRKYSLLQRNSEMKTLNIHRLVQVVLKERMNESMQRQWAAHAVRAVNHAFPQGKEFTSWPRCQLCLVHVEACAELIEEWNMAFAEAGQLLHRLGVYLREHAQYIQAEKQLWKAKEICERKLGLQHPDVAEILNDLALLYWNRGQYVKAEELYLQTLTMREQQIELRSLDVARTLNGLAALYHDQGHYTDAESFYRRALTIWERQQKLPYLDMVNTLNGLVLLYYNQGRYFEAEPLYQRALILWEQLGELSYPDMVHMLGNVALIYQYQGRQSEAEQFYQQALSIWEQQVGSEHPHTANTLSNLARLYVDQQRYTEAETLYQRALMIQEQKLGLAHPHTRRTREHYVNLLELIRK